MELIKIEERNGKQVVSAYDLYLYLGYAPKNWAQWYRKNITESQFARENEDYISLLLSRSENKSGDKRGQFAQDFALSIDFAKGISMMARTEKGEKIRRYFIECEKKVEAAKKILGDAKKILEEPRLARTTGELFELAAKAIREHENRMDSQDQRFDSMESKLNEIETKIVENPSSRHPHQKPIKTTINKRVAMMIAALGFSTVGSFATEVGMAPAVFYNIIGGRNKPAIITLDRIRHAFPALNINWVLTGEGPVLIPGRE